ncbi:uncharacterized protein LOC131458128 isoform X2 [Solea solea]|uniref:uncharacterized protein LOC131458128 isoform X2 n=1 Tax=Solea solea TaxID=90069 RepID=UPI00272995A8|nr:uncharacterized protein LOC131458128 isoform X2 [Solea solea]
MDWKNNLRRTQSQKSVTSSRDKPTRTDTAGQWDKKVSVSQRVSRYQTVVKVTSSVQAAAVNNDDVIPKPRVQKEITPSLLESTEINLPREQSQVSQESPRPSLMRAKSMGGLQSSPSSIKDLKARFELKSVTNSRAADFTSSADVTPVMNGNVEEGKRLIEVQKTHVPAGVPLKAAKTDAKEDHVTKKITPSLLESTEINLPREQSQVSQESPRPSLMRAKSMGSLQSSPGSIKDLKARFELKSVTNSRAADFTSSADVTPVMNGHVEEGKRLIEVQKTHVPAGVPLKAAKTDAKEDHVTKKITPPLLESKAINLPSPTRRHEEREQSQVSQESPRPSLMRAKSMGSLQSSPGSIKDLKARFELKSVTNSRAADFTSSADVTQVMNGHVEEGKRLIEVQKTHVPAGVPLKAAKTDAKEDHVTKKIVKKPNIVRRKTIGGIDFEEIAASEANDKRRSIADLRDSSFVQNKEALCVSVKELSALYLSMVAPKEATQSLKLAHQSTESGKRAKIFKIRWQKTPKQGKMALFHLL